MSSLEPVLVHMRMGSSAYVGVFVFVFTVVEPYMFRRYDFISMYAFRLVFYMWWHIAWGHLRLRWLFLRMIGTMAAGGDAFTDDLNTFNRTMNLGHRIADTGLDTLGVLDRSALRDLKE